MASDLDVTLRVAETREDAMIPHERGFILVGEVGDGRISCFAG